ncbi:VIT domain-containing protein [Methanolobus profundi]|uniref:von Willebrand factor type A domain-containing protein n=1 Tax=Methanolobus profundi TaxID=487685 RepID=A0A1I4SUT4_9EURY|nr:VIT domain-containing protein [Methanolobus profundi]SFM68202.1 von Willebrand factor type A domain-containing protein [Methanolobus profundi]
MDLKKSSIRAMVLLLISLACVSLIVPSLAQSNIGSDYMNIDVNIHDGYAITTVEEKLDNTGNSSVTDKFQFLIPEGAFMSAFSITIDGEEYQADILENEEAQQKFAEAVSSGRTAGLLETRDTELFSYSLNFEANQSIIVKLTYEQALARTMDEYEYLQYLQSNHVVEDLSVTVDISSSTDILSVETPGLETDISYPSTDSAKVEYSSEGLQDSDMTIVFKTENTDSDGEMLFYEINGTGYFMHIFSPTADELGTSPLNKDIIFVIDKSGSMDGMKIEQVREAFSSIITDLPENDRFNIVFFDSDDMPYSDEILMANEDNKAQAASEVLGTDSWGGTNINDALVEALEMFYAKSDNVPVIVFLTDGEPTEGVTSTAVIRQNVLEANNVDAAIFSIAFGNEYSYDFNFLQALSLENKGIAVYFEENSEASAGISDFYETISTPLVTDLVFTYDEGTNVVITGKDHLFAGSEAIILGNYDEGASVITAVADGSTGDGDYTSEHKFSVQTMDDNSFIPRLWAYNTIRDKLDMMKVEGETDELVSEVTALSLVYGFVTPYTSFFVEIPQVEEPEVDDSDMEDFDSLGSDEEMVVDMVVNEVEEAMDESMPLEEPSEDYAEEESPGFGMILALSMFGFAMFCSKIKRQ